MVSSRKTTSHPTSQNALQAALHERDIQAWAERVSVKEMHSLIKSHGVEECADLIRFLPSEKLQSVLDLDIWANKGRGKRGRVEVFDTSQFLKWMQALLSHGTLEAVDTLKDLGIEFCAGALAHYIAATPMEVYAMNKAESGLATEDKNVEHGNPLELGVYGGAYVLLKPNLCLEDVSEIMLELLSGFEQHAPEFLGGLFYQIAKQADDQVVMEDLLSDRNMRLEKEGYVPAPKAYEYLLRFRSERGLARFSRTDKEGNWTHEAWRRFLLSLHDDLIFPHETVGKVQLARDVHAERDPCLNALFVWAQELPRDQQKGFQEQWLYLANLLATGWEHLGSKLGPKKAMRLLEKTMALAVRYCAQREKEPHPDQGRIWQGNEQVQNICDVFEVGWHYLFQKLSLAAAHQLDARIRIRDPRNQDLREAWFRACSRRKFRGTCSFAQWTLEGRYRMLAEILEELEFALPADASLRLRLLLDSSPQVLDPNAAPPVQPRPRIDRPKKPRGWWIAAPGQEKKDLEQLKTELRSLDDRFVDFP